MTDAERLESAKRGYEVFTRKDKGRLRPVATRISAAIPTTVTDAWATIVKPRNLLANNLRRRAAADRPVLADSHRHQRLRDARAGRQRRRTRRERAVVWDLVIHSRRSPIPTSGRSEKARVKIDFESRRAGGEIGTSVSGFVPSRKRLDEGIMLQFAIYALLTLAVAGFRALHPVPGVRSSRRPAAARALGVPLHGRPRCGGAGRRRGPDHELVAAERARPPTPAGSTTCSISFWPSPESPTSA